MAKTANLSIKMNHILKDETMQEAIAASERIWQNSIQNGTDKMAMDAVDEEIAEARAERKSRGTDS